MDAETIPFPDAENHARRSLILVESPTHWVVIPRNDPRLEVGSTFEHGGELWTVTWDSDHGFADQPSH
jgi:hypothetical protein